MTSRMPITGVGGVPPAFAPLQSTIPGAPYGIPNQNHLAPVGAGQHRPVHHHHPVTSQLVPPAAATNSFQQKLPNFVTDKRLWQWDVITVEQWLRSLPTIYPKHPLDKTAPAVAAPTTNNDGIVIPELTMEEQMTQYKIKMITMNTMIHHLIVSLASAATAGSAAQPKERDMYNILDSSFAKGETVVHIPGSIMSRLELGGMINALSGTVGGLVHPVTCKILVAENKTTAPVDVKSVIPAETLKFARLLQRSVSGRLEMDMLESTPSRIVELICAEVSMSEVTAIRRRIVETVIHGRGTGASERVEALESVDAPVSARVVADSEKWKRCKVCGENDQGNFALDKKNGDCICMECGTVAAESIMHEGSQFRKFEGEADRNHHGDAQNPLYSNAHNMSTTLGGLGFQSGAGASWGGMGGTRNMENILRNAHAYTEMNVSQFGKEEKKTRVGYKDRQKKEAFIKMKHTGDALNLHEAVVQRAKELFAGFRDDRELVQQFLGVVAACLCEAFDQLSKDGRQILRLRAGEMEDVEIGPDGEIKTSTLKGRANWRQNMHNSSAAGTTMFGSAPTRKDGSAGGIAAENSEVKSGPSAQELKHAAAWSIDDCRAWLLEASQSIAHQQVTLASTQDEKTNSSSLPHGPTTIAAKPQELKRMRDEKQGKLLGHTLTIINHLEQELTKKNGTIKSGNRLRVTTPRVQHMGSLGMKWQGSHERGSGGKGGVGNSARRVNGAKHGESEGRTAGQILILKTAKKLAAITKDAGAGEAFHNELKALMGRQSNRKRKERSDENAQQRFKQMKRKPWLQVRAGAG